MFDITPMLNQPFSTFVTAKNAREGEFEFLDKNGKWIWTKGTLQGYDPSKQPNKEGKRPIKINYKDNGFTMERYFEGDHYDEWQKIRLDTLSDRYNWERVRYW